MDSFYSLIGQSIMMIALGLLLWRNRALKRENNDLAHELHITTNMLRSYQDQANPGPAGPEGMESNVPGVAPGRESQNSRPKSLAPSTPDFMKPRPSITEILHSQDREGIEISKDGSEAFDQITQSMKEGFE